MCSSVSVQDSCCATGQNLEKYDIYYKYRKLEEGGVGTNPRRLMGQAVRGHPRGPTKYSATPPSEPTAILVVA